MWEVIKQGRTGEGLVSAHTNESIIANALWKIRDAIHGPGSWQGQPTLVTEHTELFGEGGRKDRDMGYARVLELIRLVLHSILNKVGVEMIPDQPFSVGQERK